MKPHLRTSFVWLVLIICFIQLSGITGFTAFVSTAYESDSLQTVQSEQNQMRVPEKEPDLNTLCFNNGDGTETVVFYKYPVKYIDDCGQTRDVDLNIKKSKGDYLYEVADHFLHFGFLQSAVEICMDNTTIQFKTLNESPTNNINVNDNIITYEGAYDNDTHLRYMITYAGLDQQIILDKYSGKNEFEIIITGSNINIEDNLNGGYSIIINNDKTNTIDIGSVIAFDSSDRFTEGNMSITFLPDGDYLLKISIDDSFLSDNQLQYPVIIDPTYTWSAIANQNYIEDTTIYSGKTTLNTGSWLYNHAGYASDGYNVGRILVRLPGMYGSTLYQNLLGIQITEAVFGIYEATGTAGRTVNLYPYTGTSWTESTATWSNTSPNSYGTLVDSKQPAYGGLTEYNILSLVKNWKEETFDETKGFMLKNSNESNTAYLKAFNSAEYGSSVPYVKITYTSSYTIDNLEDGTYYIRNKSTGKYLSAPASGTSALKQFDYYSTEKWQIYKNTTDGTYQIISVSDYLSEYGNNTYCLYGFSPQYVGTAIGADTETDRRMNWHIITLSTGIAFVNDKQNSHWLSGSSSGIGLSLIYSTDTLWELVKCSNPYTINYNGNFDKINETDLIDQMNCYAFAMGLYKLGGENNVSATLLQPGEIADAISPLPDNEQRRNSYWDYFQIHRRQTPDGNYWYYFTLTDSLSLVEDTIIDCVKQDLQSYYGNILDCDYIVPSSYEENVVGPWRKVALVIDYNSDANNPYDICSSDYHWYIEQDDGTWCHKPGPGEATNLDSSGSVIVNPETCDRRIFDQSSAAFSEYEFCGFYKIHIDTTIKYAFKDLVTGSYDVAGDTLDEALPIGIFYGGGYSFNGKIEYGQTPGFSYLIDYTDSSEITMDLPVDVDIYEFMVGVDGTYTFSSNSISQTTGILYEGDQYINHNINSDYNDFGFSITAILTAGKLYRLCVISDSTAFNTTYTVTVTRLY